VSFLVSVCGVQLLEAYPNVLTLRLRMPISDDLNPRNFITKISKYEKVPALFASVRFEQI
jgi:hypothetical protein